MNFQEYADKYPEISEWITNNAPEDVIDAITFINQRNFTHIKLLQDAVNTQNDFMETAALYQQASLDNNKKLCQKYSKNMNTLYQRILFLKDQMDAFIAEGTLDKK